MMPKPWKLVEATQKDVIEMDPPYQVAVLPFGSIEPHNYHLPYGTDFFEADMLADRVCGRAWEKGARVVLLPAVPYGVTWNMMKFPMTISANPSTHMALLRDIIKSLLAHNIRKLVVFNSHGGNEFKGILRELYAETDMFIALAEWWTCSPELDRVLFKETGYHAGEMETSVALALFPDKVRAGDADAGKYRASRFEAVNSGVVWIARPWHNLTHTSGCGDPGPATAEKGEKFIESFVEKLAAFVAELSRAEMDDLFPYI